MFEVILALLLGVLVGIFTGLIPGVHINLVAAILLTSFSYLLTNFPEIDFIVFIVSLAITHTFLDFIPSIFLGAPSEDTVLSALPGHKFLVRGYGHTAVQLTLLGSIAAIILLVFIIPIFFILVPLIYPFVERMMAFFLIWISFILIILEKKGEVRILTSIVFVLAGFLGMASFNMGLDEPLLPLLTGLFGSSTLIYSIKSKTKIPEQIIERVKVEKKELIKPLLATALVSPISSFFPGLGSSQAAIIGSGIFGRLNREQFLILLGSVNTLVMAVSFTTLFLIQKSRTGAANAISDITSLTSQNFGFVVLGIVGASLIAIPLTLFLSKIVAKNISKFSYSKVSFFVLAFLTILIIQFSGLFGFLIFLVSTLLGLTCTSLGVRKGFLMGSLLIPTILFYLPL